MQTDEQMGRSVSRRAAVRSMGGATLGGAALGAFGALGAAGVAHAEGDAPPLVGVWLFSGAVAPLTSPSLVFVFPGGIALYAGSSQRPTQRTDDPPATLEYQTISGGQWLQTGFNEYAFALTGIDYDAQNNPIGVDTTRYTLTYDPVRDTCSASVTVTEADLNGVVTASSTATAVGRRLTVTP